MENKLLKSEDKHGCEEWYLVIDEDGLNNALKCGVNGLCPACEKKRYAFLNNPKYKSEDKQR